VRTTALVALGLVLATGCLELPAGKPNQCKVTADCNTAAGEVCDEGVCWGNPPAGQYAATLSAPALRPELVATELMSLSLPADGWLGALVLEPGIRISGRVEAYCAAGSACTNLSLAATIYVTRPSRIPGGPPFKATAESKPDVARGSESFSLVVPRVQDGDENYVLMVVPKERGDQPPAHGGTAASELGPPRRVQLPLASSFEFQNIVLGGPSSPIITGSIKDGLGAGLGKYRVVARGRFEPGGAMTEVSSVAYTASGQFSITLSDNITGPIELEARSYDSSVVAPILYLSNLAATAQHRTLSQPIGVGNPRTIELRILGKAGDGEVRPIGAARVGVTGVYDTGVPSPSVRAVVGAEMVTGDDGIARLTVLDGPAFAASYKLRVVPPSGSTRTVVYDQAIELDQVASELLLPARVALRGRVTDSTGAPLGDVSVTARPSPLFRWSLDDRHHDFLAKIPPASAITLANGEFVVWVDPTLGDTWGYYDLMLETPASSHAPNWQVTDIEIPRDPNLTTFSLRPERTRIPEASRLRGIVVDLEGNAIEGSGIRVYQIDPNPMLCGTYGNVPESCTPDARAVGGGESDKKGVFRLTLPRP
jgi:hypothetical protein